MTATRDGGARFEDAARYASYLNTVEGRLRADLSFANIMDFLRDDAQLRRLRALDLGGGTGEAALRLARMGFDVTLLDASAQMILAAQARFAEAGLQEKIEVIHAGAEKLVGMFEEGTFDVVLCHNLLEYVDGPSAVLQAVARLMRTSSGLLSLLVRSQAGEVLKAALRTADLIAAEHCLNAESCRESLYGGEARLFTPERTECLLASAGLASMARRAVRAITDYLPPAISRSTEYERIFALERRLSMRPEFFGMARYMQFLARRGSA